MRIKAVIIVPCMLLAVACSDDSSNLPQPDTFQGDISVISDLPVTQPDGPISQGDGLVTTQDGAIVFNDAGIPSDQSVYHDSSPNADQTIYPDIGTGPVTCGAGNVVIQEVATGQPDYLTLKNNAKTPVSIDGFLLVMTGITPSTPDKYIFGSGVTISAGGVIYVFEYASGNSSGDVNTGDNIPFYDNQDSNSVALYNSSLQLVDFVAIGDQVMGLPNGANATAVPWPTNWDEYTQSFQRSGYQGTCPNFLGGDWAAAAITRP